MRLFQTEPSLVPIKQFDGHGDQIGTQCVQCTRLNLKCPMLLCNKNAMIIANF